MLSPDCYWVRSYLITTVLNFFAIFLKYDTLEGVFSCFCGQNISKDFHVYLIQIFGMKLEEISRENAVGTFCVINAPSEMKKKIEVSMYTECSIFFKSWFKMLIRKYVQCSFREQTQTCHKTTRKFRNSYLCTILIQTKNEWKDNLWSSLKW